MVRRERRILITFDLDFGELYYFSSQKVFGVIVLRLDDQRVEVANAVIEAFLRRYLKIFKKGRKYLVILGEGGARIIQ